MQTAPSPELPSAQPVPLPKASRLGRAATCLSRSKVVRRGGAAQGNDDVLSYHVCEVLNGSGLGDDMEAGRSVAGRVSGSTFFSSKEALPWNTTHT